MMKSYLLKKIRNFIFSLDRLSAKSYLLKAIKNEIKYPYYAYIMYVGAEQAKRLGIDNVSAIEFGVAGGNGLVAMERHAAVIEKELGVHIDVYGFDTGIGMPPAVDEKDMPHLFVEGNYAMNEEKLRAELNSAELIIGDAVETFPQFLSTLKNPVAAISFDLDHFYSTFSILNELAKKENTDLSIPRLLTYFDNTVGNHLKAYNEFAGELLAINEFNQLQERSKITLCRDFKRFGSNSEWYNQIYFLHFFDHSLYNKKIINHKPTSLQLK